MLFEPGYLLLRPTRGLNYRCKGSVNQSAAVTLVQYPASISGNQSWLALQTYSRRFEQK